MTHTSRKRLRRSQTRDPSLEKKDFFFFFFTFQMILNKVHFFSLWVFFVYGIWQRPWHLGAALYPFGSGAPLPNGSAAPRMLPVCHLFSKYDLCSSILKTSRGLRLALFLGKWTCKGSNFEEIKTEIPCKSKYRALNGTTRYIVYCSCIVGSFWLPK